MPTDKEYTAWKNDNFYGVWIDGEKVHNAVLNNYKDTNFEQATISKLYIELQNGIRTISIR